MKQDKTRRRKRSRNKKERKKIRSSSIQNETSDPSLSRVHPSQNSPLYQIKHRSKNYQNTLDEDKEGKQEGEYKCRIKKKTRGRVVTTGGLSRLSRMIRAGSPSPPTSKEWSRKAGWRGLCSSSRRDPLPGMRLLPVSSFLSLISPWFNPSCSLHRGYSLMFFIKLTLAVRGTLSPRCLHNIVYNSGCAEFHFILAGGPYTYRSLVCSLSSLFRPSPTPLPSRSNCLPLSSRGVPSRSLLFVREFETKGKKYYMAEGARRGEWRGAERGVLSFVAKNETLAR